MKTIKIYFIALISLLSVFQSCRQEYLNEPKPTDAVSPEVVYGSKEGATAFLSGILRSTRGQYTSTDSGNLTSLYFARTVKGNDIILSGSWFLFDYANNNREPNYRRPGFTWNYLYNIINKINAFIQGVSESKSIAEEDKKALLGQAYTMRAWMYFELSLEFQHTYTYDPNLPAPPIYDMPNSVEGKGMSTQKELYDFINADIQKALDMGSFDRVNKSYFNKQITYGLAARVNQVMGNWVKAAEYAHAAYGGNVGAVLDSSMYGNGFDDMDANKEWMLAIPQSSDQSAYYWIAPSVFMDVAGATYKNGFINKSLVNSFSDTDVRKLFSSTGRTNYLQYYTTKFKFSFSADVALMRTPEMILIEAEALYHTNPNAAHDLLYELQVNRDPSAVKSTNTGEALLNEILLERRKELYGEIGVEWYDAKRLRRGLPRDPWHRVNMANDPLMPDDKRFFLKVPQSEIDANPNIPASVNDGR